MMRTKPFAATLAILIVALDILTKRWALRALGDGEVIPLFGGVVPLSLAFNTGAAFSLSLGAASRWVFTALSVVVLIVLGDMFRKAAATERLRLYAAALVMAGAVGNLIDRVRWDRGVVDFIGPIDLGFMLWPVFNVADMAITCGAVLLAISLGFGERKAAPAPQS
jgi:signal peptidase II